MFIQKLILGNALFELDTYQAWIQDRLIMNRIRTNIVVDVWTFKSELKPIQTEIEVTGMLLCCATARVSSQQLLLRAGQLKRTTPATAHCDDTLGSRRSIVFEGLTGRPTDNRK